MARWSGPPPLLIVATALGALLAPAVGSADDDARAPARASIVAQSTPLGPTGSPTSTRTSTSGMSTSGPGAPSMTSPTTAPAARPSPPASAPGGAAPDEPGGFLAPRLGRPITPAPAPALRPVRRQLLGLATFNHDRSLSDADAREDARTIIRRRGVTIIGWQEGEHFGPVYSLLERHGWDTARSRPAATPGEAGELAVSWRRSRFALVSSRLHRVTFTTDEGRTPYADRHVLRVTLRETRTGRLISVIDTHLPPALEGTVHRGGYRNPASARRGRLQLSAVDSAFDRARGRWVLGTGDYGFGAHAEIEVQPMGGISRMLAGSALSTYAVAGSAGVDPTDIRTNRYTDYALLRRTDLDTGRSEVLGHRTLGAINSDHRPLLAWLALS